MNKTSPCRFLCEGIRETFSIDDEKPERFTEDTELIQRKSVEMLLFYFKYARCIVSHVGEVALKLSFTFTTFRVQFGIDLLE